MSIELPIVLPIALPIALPMASPIALPIGPIALYWYRLVLSDPSIKPRPGPGQWGRGRDPLGQGPGPGPLGPGAWGPLGPRFGIRVENVTTDCQAGYLLSGKLPTIRQAISRIRDAPKRHIHAPKRLHILCTQQPHTLHPTEP